MTGIESWEMRGAEKTTIDFTRWETQEQKPPQSRPEDEDSASVMKTVSVS